MKKILINLLPFNDDRFNGVENFTIGILSELNNSVYLEFLCKTKFPLKKIIPSSYTNYKIIKIPLIRSGFIRVLFEQFLLILFSFKFDVIYSPFNAGPIIKSNRCNSIITIHDLLPFNKDCKYPFFRKHYLKWITSHSFYNSNSIVTVSNTSKNNIYRQFGSSKKIHVIYNSLPYTNISEPIKSDPPFLLILGGINKDKNIDKILLGFKFFLDTHDDLFSQSVRILIAGSDQGFLSQLRSLILELNLSHNVEYLGYISEDYKNHLLSKCTSLFMFGNDEGFGIPALELLHFSKFPIIINRGALPEICGNYSFCINSFNVNDISCVISVVLNYDYDFDKSGLYSHLSRFNRQIISNNFINQILK